MATLRWVDMASGKKMPVNPVADPTGNVAARRIGGRYAAGYVLRHGEEPKPGFTVFRGHFLDCPPDAPKHTRAESFAAALF
jgi:hypothetical protein